tara:strand:+ start:203 stop:580 length:378 start_codon:yes stop_codon:yes gene_type:complete
MSNKILKFADFKNGNPLQDPKKHALTTKGEPKPKKEKSLDQVKRSNLGQLTVTQPDYSKTQKIDESVESLAIQVEIDKINIELKGLIPTAADYAAKKLELDTKLLDLTKKMAAQTETDAKAVVKP